MKLKKIYNRLFPLKGFKALTICPFVFVREEERDTFGEAGERHETTHALQQVECLVVGAILAVAMFFAGCGWWSLVPLGSKILQSPWFHRCDKLIVNFHDLGPLSS